MTRYFRDSLRFFQTLWRYRTLIWVLAMRELSVRYKGSFLGFLWTFINPLLIVCVYSVVFGALFKGRVENYALYVFSGQLIWATVAGSLNDGSAAMAANSGLITRAALPPEIVPARVVVAHAVNYLLTLPLFLAATVFYGTFSQIWLSSLQLIVVLPIIFLFLFAIVTGVSILGALFRDVQHLVSSLTFVLFFTTPIMFQLEMLPESLQRILSLSPFTLVVQVAADALFYGRIVEPISLLTLLIYGVVSLAFSLLAFTRLRRYVAERV